jgi:hypothetical protein
MRWLRVLRRLVRRRDLLSQPSLTDRTSLAQRKISLAELFLNLLQVEPTFKQI